MRFNAVLAMLALGCLSFFIHANDDDELLNEVKQAQDVKSIDTISIEDFQSSRTPFKNRPKPVGLNFDDAAVAKYISSLPKDMQKTEGERYENIKQVKPYLVRLFERNPYSGNGLLLQSKGEAKPVKRNLMVTMANDKYLVTKVNANSKKPTRHYWNELDFEQYEVFFEYFINKRVGVSAGDVVSKDVEKHAANDYLLLSMLCDWYGRYDKAIDYAKKAIERNSSIKKQANNLLLVKPAAK